MELTATPSQMPEIWQVDAGGQIYETNFEEMAQWIAEGALLPQDKVKRGNLRWIEAQKVPQLNRFFNAKSVEATTQITTNHPSPSENLQITNPPNVQRIHNPKKNEPLEGFQPNPANFNLGELDNNNRCLLHENSDAKFVCETCANHFCPECPRSVSEKVKFCPMCGALVKPIAEAKAHAEMQETWNLANTEKFGFKDFGRALGYPFKFPASLIFGAIFFMFCAIGTDAASLGGRWLISASIISWMVGNTLIFGILAHSVENLLAGRLNQNFMPSFDDFTLWDDVIHPFFLNIGIYLSSFGALIILLIVMFFFVASAVKNDIQSLNQKTVSTFTPELQNNYGAAQNGEKQIQFTKEALKLQEQYRQRQMEAIQKQSENYDDYLTSMENGEVPANSQAKPAQTPVYDEEKEFQNLNEMINQSRKEQLESSIGKNSEANEMPYSSVVSTVRTWAMPFLVLAIICFAWGVFYLPVAYIVAAYTRNLGSVFNPFVGLDTIKRLGFDYVKILFMCLVLLVLSGIINIFLRIIFAPLDLPRLGNIPAIAVGSIFTFYFSIVFALVLGFALFKNSKNFQLYQNG